jgi:hypothetical protein
MRGQQLTTAYSACVCTRLVLLVFKLMACCGTRCWGVYFGTLVRGFVPCLRGYEYVE